MKKIKLGICSWCFPKKDLLSSISLFPDLGMTALELNMPNFENYEFLDKDICDKYKEQCAAYNVEMTSIGINCVCPNTPFKEENNDILQKIMEISHQAAKNLGIKILQVPAFGQAMIKTPEEFDSTVKFLQKYCDIVAEDSITVSSENTLSTQENLDLVKAVNRNNFAIYFDTQNPYQVNGYDVPEMIEKIYDDVCEMHMKDGTTEMSNKLLGEGNSDFFKTAEIIKNKAYSGTIHLENNYLKIADGDEAKAFEFIKKDIETLRKIYDCE